MKRRRKVHLVLLLRTVVRGDPLYTFCGRTVREPELGTGQNPGNGFVTSYRELDATAIPSLVTCVRCRDLEPHRSYRHA